jgi:hypothetical protein
MTEAELRWIKSEFERCKQWIEAAIAREAVATHDIDDVREAVEAGIAQIWPRPKSCMVTTIETYPKAKFVRGWLAGGDLDEIKQTCAPDGPIERWAKRQGCTWVVIGGRKGWLRAFSGYRESCTVMIKELQ